MKHFLLVIILFFSVSGFSQTYDFLGTDFAPFPLSTGNIALIEGVWRGETIDIKINDSGIRLSNKPMMWVEVSDYKAGETRKGFMYYSPSEDRYNLYMFVAKTIIPIDLEVFEFSSQYATDTGMACKSGGTLLKIEFSIASTLGEVLLTKESCY